MTKNGGCTPPQGLEVCGFHYMTIKCPVDETLACDKWQATTRSPVTSADEDMMMTLHMALTEYLS